MFTVLADSRSNIRTGRIYFLAGQTATSIEFFSATVYYCFVQELHGHSD